MTSLPTATPRNRPENFGTTSPACSGPSVSSCTPREDQDRVLPGHEPPRAIGAHLLRFPGLHLPGPPGPWPERLLRELLTGHQHHGQEGSRPEGSALAPQPSQRVGPVRPRPTDQPGGPRLDRLLRSLLPLRALLPGTAHRSASAAMGHAEVQTPARQTSQGPSVAGHCSTATAASFRPLAPRRTHLSPTCGSRMTGDCHVRFCERRRVRLPPATHQKSRRQDLACRPPAVPDALHTNLFQLGQPSRRFLATSPKTFCNAAITTPSNSWKPTSAAGSKTGTPTPNLSSGPRPPTRSSNPSDGY